MSTTPLASTHSVPPLALAPGPFATVPNLVTAVRTFLAVGLGLVAAAEADLRLLAVAYGVYWIGDVADGWTARRLDQETRAGAVLDIVSDRACAGVLCVGLVTSVDAARPVLPVVFVFLLSFMVLDTMLSLAFLCWPLRGPNDFHLVDRRVWGLNWSPVAKATNTGAVVGALALGLAGVALVVAAVAVCVKVWSARRVAELLRAGHFGIAR